MSGVGRGKSRNNSPTSAVGMDTQDTSVNQLAQTVTEAAQTAASQHAPSPEFARAIAQSVVAALDASIVQIVDAAFQRLMQQQQQQQQQQLQQQQQQQQQQQHHNNTTTTSKGQELGKRCVPRLFGM